MQALKPMRWWLPCLLALGACSNADAGTGVSPDVSLAMFEAEVYPYLLRDCAFSECHGKPERFFQLWGPGRTRLHPEIIDRVLVFRDGATEAEIDALVQEQALELERERVLEIKRSYERARAMLATDENVDDSLFLRKPLEPFSGGQGHKGVDEFGRNVYQYKEDPAFVVLSRWAHSTVGEQPLPIPGAAGTGAVAGMGGP